MENWPARENSFLPLWTLKNKRAFLGRYIEYLRVNELKYAKLP